MCDLHDMNWFACLCANMTCMQVGMLRTAAGLFQDLGLYKEMVECYIAMDEEQEAEKIVSEQVGNNETYA
jgi:hypothetical protein